MQHEISVHLVNISGKCQFDLTKGGDAIVIVGKDCTLKVAELTESKLEIVSQHDIQEETYSISMNPQNDKAMVICGQSGQVELISDFNIEQPQILMNKSQCNFDNVKYDQTGRYIVAISSLENTPDWHPNYYILAIPGNSTLQLLQQNHNNGQWIITQDTCIKHPKENICITSWIHSNIELLVTCGLDKCIILWNFEKKYKLKEFVHDEYMQNIKYSSSFNTLIFCDASAQICLWRNFILFNNNNNNNTLSNIPNYNLMDSHTEQQNIQQLSNNTNYCLQKQKNNIQAEPDDLIGFIPQNILYPTQTQFFSMRRFLCWNTTGTVSQRKETDKLVIDIEFADKEYHKNVSIIDAFNFQMAALNHRGVLLASSLPKQDKSEQEMQQTQENNYSVIQYQCFSALYEKQDWLIKLPEYESVEQIALGNNWCAVFTDLHNIRVYTLQGLELRVQSFSKPLVCLSAYENLLVIVYHNSLPVLGCQSLQMYILDIETMKLFSESEIPLSPYSNLQWFGFSEEGMILSHDTEGIIRIYQFNECIWIPVFDQNKDTKKNNKIWLIGASNYQLYCILLKKDELEPKVNPRQQICILDMSVPFINGRAITQDKLNGLSLNKIKKVHEVFRKGNFLRFKECRIQIQDNVYNQKHMNIYTDTQHKSEDEYIDKILLEILKDHIVQNQYEKALSICQMLKSIKSVEIAQNLCQKLNLPGLVSRIQIILQDKNSLIKQQILLTLPKRSISGSSAIQLIDQQSNVNTALTSSHSKQKKSPFHYNSYQHIPEENYNSYDNDDDSGDGHHINNILRKYSTQNQVNQDNQNNHSQDKKRKIENEFTHEQLKKVKQQ